MAAPVCCNTSSTSDWCCCSSNNSRCSGQVETTAASGDQQPGPACQAAQAVTASHSTWASSLSSSPAAGTWCRGLARPSRLGWPSKLQWPGPCNPHTVHVIQCRSPSRYPAGGNNSAKLSSSILCNRQGHCNSYPASTGHCQGPNNSSGPKESSIWILHFESTFEGKQ